MEVLALGGQNADGLVDVTRHNFAQSLPAVRAALAECDFVAFDCEMTGLFLESNGNAYIDDMPDRYAKMYQSARAFAINQFGLSTFSLTEGRYVAKTFNFNLFPRSFQAVDKRFTSQASSLEYLAQHNFDFNKMVYDGISYLPLQQRDRLLEDVDKPTNYPPFAFTNDADRSFAAELEALVTEWYGEREARATLAVGEGWNSYQRAIFHSVVATLRFGDESGWQGFYAESVGEWPTSFMQLTRATRAEAHAHAQRVRAAKIAAIQDAAGFSEVLQLMRAARKPVVGHNMLFDVIFSLNMFVSDLPHWRGFKAAMATWFPAGLYDTKHICKTLNAAHDDIIEGTSLGTLFVGLQSPDARLLACMDAAGHDARWFAFPEVEHAPDFTRYSDAAGSQYAHEAGFDAFMTGACFARLLALASAVAAPKDTLPPLPELAPPPSPRGAATPASPAAGRPHTARDAVATNLQSFSTAALGEAHGRINVMRTDMPYCDPFGADPQLRRDHMLVLVSEGRPSPSYRQIRGSLRDLNLGSLKLEAFLSGPSYSAVAMSWAAVQEILPEMMAQVSKAMANDIELDSVKVMTWPEYSLYKLDRQYATGYATETRSQAPRTLATAAFASTSRSTLKRPRVDTPARSPRPNLCTFM